MHGDRPEMQGWHDYLVARGGPERADKPEGSHFSHQELLFYVSRELRYRHRSLPCSPGPALL